MRRKSCLVPILKLLNELLKEMICQACQEFCHLFVTSLMHIIIMGSIYCMTPKLPLNLVKNAWNNALMLPYNYMRNHYRRHYIALPKFVIH